MKNQLFSVYFAHCNVSRECDVIYLFYRNMVRNSITEAMEIRKKWKKDKKRKFRTRSPTHPQHPAPIVNHENAVSLGLPNSLRPFSRKTWSVRQHSETRKSLTVVTLSVQISCPMLQGISVEPTTKTFGWSTPARV